MTCYKTKLPLIVLIVFCLMGLTFFTDVARAKELVILHTNDIHGRIDPFIRANKSVGGLARLSTVLNRIKSQHKNILLLDAGDTIQGTLYYSIFNGVPQGKIMSYLGYTALALGNHEFDKGEMILADFLKTLSFPILSANISVKPDSPLYGKYVPYIIKEVDGLKVGIIGVVTDELPNISKIHATSTVESSIEKASQIAQEISNQVDLTIVLSHIGLNEDIQLAQKSKFIDLIVGGHSHTLLKRPRVVYNQDGKKVLIIQSGEFAEYLGKLTLHINNKNIHKYDYKTIHMTHSIPEDTVVREMIKPYKEEVDKLQNDLIGQTKSDIDFRLSSVRTKEASGGNFICDAILKLYPNLDGCMQNGGSMRGNSIHNKGNIQRGDILNYLPFNNELMFIDIQGKNIKLALEGGVRKWPEEYGGFLQVGNIAYTVKANNQPQRVDESEKKILQEGNRITQVLINKKPLENNKYYKIAINDFIYYGGNNIISLHNGMNVRKTGKTMAEVIIEYIQKFSPIETKLNGRIKIVED